MGCCLSQPEPDSEPISTHLSNDLSSPTVPPPQYNEQQDYVVETGKTKDPIETGSKSNSSPVQEEKKTTLPTSSFNSGAADDTAPWTSWPIFIRSSMSGKDIPIQLPGTTPFWTVQQLRQHIEPQLQTQSPVRIRFIYLGKILNDDTLLMPNTTTSTSNALWLDKHAVIQAMVSTITS